MTRSQSATTAKAWLSQVRLTQAARGWATGACLALAATADAGPAQELVTWFGPSQAPTSNASWTPGSTAAQHYGVAFVSGPAGNYTMDWMSIGLNTSSTATSGSGTLVVELRGATSLTPYSAVSNDTVLASDTIAFNSPTTTATNFTVALNAASFPNIATYAMAANTGYALRLWGPSGGYGIQRTTGYANGTTNGFYEVNDGFAALNTFRNGTPNYTNTANSYPTLAIAFGGVAVPEASASSLALAAALGAVGWRLVRRRRANGQRG
ncbi:MAG: hypothetical protein ACK5XN_16495 [Bacteroidota bacterium]